jgi:hypothetical protein
LYSEKNVYNILVSIAISSNDKHSLIEKPSTTFELTPTLQANATSLPCESKIGAPLQPL